MSRVIIVVTSTRFLLAYGTLCPRDFPTRHGFWNRYSTVAYHGQPCRNLTWVRSFSGPDDHFCFIKVVPHEGLRFPSALCPWIMTLQDLGLWLAVGGAWRMERNM